MDKSSLVGNRRAVAYYRLTVGSGQRLSTLAGDCERYAAGLGTEITEAFIDNAVIETRHGRPETAHEPTLAATDGGSR